MTADLTGIVERALAASAQGEAGAAMAMFAPDVVAHYAPSLPIGGDHHGLTAYLEALSELNRLFALEVVDAEVVDAGDRVLLLLDVTYTAASSGRSTRQRSVEILRFTGQRVSDVAVFHHDTAALLAALGRAA